MISTVFLAAAMLCAAAAASAQAVGVTIPPLAPFADPFSERASRRADSCAVALHAMACLGSPGTVQGVEPEGRQGHFFTGVDLLFSAGALPTPGGKDYEVVGNLRRRHARVTLTPLDSLRRPLTDRAAAVAAPRAGLAIPSQSA